MKHGFGRLPSPHDERDHKMADAVRQLSRLPRPVKTWHSDRVLNQAQTNHCVGFAWAAYGISTPVEDPWGDAEGHALYRACKVIDGDPAGEMGSTLRSGAKAMLARGRIGSYYFAASVDEALDYVARFGPVVFGTEWRSRMSLPSLAGNVIRPVGPVKGGHAWLAWGVNATHVTIRNSWGADWGDKGNARISIVDLKWLFAGDGEAVAASELPLS